MSPMEVTYGIPSLSLIFLSLLGLLFFLAELTTAAAAKSSLTLLSPPIGKIFILTELLSVLFMSTEWLLFRVMLPRRFNLALRPLSEMMSESKI